MPEVIGIDGCKGGWIAVSLVDGRFADCLKAATLVEILSARPDTVAIGIDMPIGLLESGSREADRAAREFVGPRRSSVFEVPLRPVLELENYAEANALSRELTGKGISKQSFNLRDKIWEADALRADRRVFEVHPEVCFCAMKGGHLLSPKKTWNGLMERVRLLEREGIQLPDHHPCAEVVADDLVDAAAAAWTAGRWLRGEAGRLPERDGQTVGEGRPVAIWY